MSNPQGPDHLVKILAERGVASRRGSERLIRAGEVIVDGSVLTDPGALVDPRAQRVLVEGEPLPPQPRRRTLVLYKPTGIITTRADPENRRTVFDLIADDEPALAAVGRLDYGSEGVLLVTSDGELAYRLSHPSYGVPKTYLVKVSGTPDERKLRQLRSGVTLDDGRTRPALVTQVLSKGPSTWLLFTLHEGRNRVIRRMVESVGHRTLKLKRVAFGGITLRGLKPGEARELTPGELEHLRHQVARPGDVPLKVSIEVRRAVAEALRLPLPSRDEAGADRSRDSEGRPYRAKGWARPKPKGRRAAGSRRKAGGKLDHKSRHGGATGKQGGGKQGGGPKGQR